VIAKDGWQPDIRLEGGISRQNAEEKQK